MYQHGKDYHSASWLQTMKIHHKMQAHPPLKTLHPTKKCCSFRYLCPQAKQINEKNSIIITQQGGKQISGRLASYTTSSI